MPTTPAFRCVSICLPAVCCCCWLQRKRDALKDVVRGHVALKVQAIKELESTLELPDLGTEGWNVQLFRSIDSSECSRSSSSIGTRTSYKPCTNLQDVIASSVVASGQLPSSARPPWVQQHLCLPNCLRRLSLPLLQTLLTASRLWLTAPPMRQG